MTGWICKRCETGNGAHMMACEVCNSPLLYTHEELEQVIVQRVNEVREELEAKAKAAAKLASAAKPEPARNPVPETPVSSGDSCAVWFLVFLLIIVLAAVLYVAVFEPALWNVIRTDIIQGLQ